MGTSRGSMARPGKPVAQSFHTFSPSPRMRRHAVIAARKGGRARGAGREPAAQGSAEWRFDNQSAVEEGDAGHGGAVLVTGRRGEAILLPARHAGWPDELERSLTGYVSCGREQTSLLSSRGAGGD
jgi:hypothetical protein